MSRQHSAIRLSMCAVVLLHCCRIAAQSDDEESSPILPPGVPLLVPIDAFPSAGSGFSALNFEQVTAPEISTHEFVGHRFPETDAGSQNPDETFEARDDVANFETAQPYWYDGLKTKTHGRRHDFSIGGRIDVDVAGFVHDPQIEDTFGRREPSAEFRRARLHFDGQFYETVVMRAVYDFADSDQGFKSAWLGLSGDDGHEFVRVGFFNEPFSLERLTRSRFALFTERSLPDALTPDRNLGIMFSTVRDDQMGTFAWGVFRDSDSFGLVDDHKSVNLTGRKTRLLLYQDDGARLVHVGASYSLQHLLNDRIRIRQRPESMLAQHLVDTGTIAADINQVIGLELACVDGPLSVQAEYNHSFVHALNEPSPDFRGFYIQTSFFLTGEHRPYQRSRGRFTRLVPINNFDWFERTPGAIELALRSSHITLSDGRQRGGRLTDATFGLNWYLNPDTRVMLDYILADRHGIGAMSIFQARCQLDF